MQQKQIIPQRPAELTSNSLARVVSSSDLPPNTRCNLQRKHSFKKAELQLKTYSASYASYSRSKVRKNRVSFFLPSFSNYCERGCQYFERYEWPSVVDVNGGLSVVRGFPFAVIRVGFL